MTNPNKSSLKGNTTSLDKLPHFANFEQGLPVLSEKLNYQFRDISLPRRALTHRSYNPKESYERLS